MDTEWAGPIAGTIDVGQANQWGNPYGWNNGFYNRYRGTNVAYHRGRRSGVVNTNGRAHAAMIQSTKVKKNRTVNTSNPPRRVITPKPRRVIENNNTPIIRTKPVRRTRTVVPIAATLHQQEQHE